jgi:CelD/BcsL family acetyltransferase involved in cellulose biosynthesis
MADTTGELSRDGRAAVRLPARRAEEAPALPVPRRAAGRIHVSIHSDLAEVETDWRAFEAIAARTAFQTYDWMAKWQRHIGQKRGVVPTVVVGRDNDLRTLFIFPFAIETGPLLRRLTWLASDQCDYNVHLIEPEFLRRLTPPAFVRLWAHITACLQADPRFAFDLIDLQKMPQSFEGRSNPFLALPVRPNPSGAHAATLTGNWETFYTAKRSAKRRRVERADQRHLGERGSVILLEPDEAAGRAHVIDTLIAQKRRALAAIGADDIFASRAVRAFYRDVVTDPAMAPYVHVCGLDVGGRTGATTFALTHGNGYYLVLSSYDEGLSTLGPGRVLLHRLIRAAIERGFSHFDFTIGDEAYKREWCDVSTRLYDFSAAVTTRAMPAAAAMTVARSVKRFVKQTPLVWQTYTSVRTSVAAIFRRVAGLIHG